MFTFFRASRWYWLCQLVGWAGLWGTQLQAHLMLGRYTPIVPLSLTATAVAGLLLTHGYRALLLRFGVLRAPLVVQAAVAVGGLLGLSVSLFGSDLGADALISGQLAWPGWATFTFGVIGLGRYLIVWVLGYHFFAVGEWLAQTEVNQLKAEAARRQAELDMLRSQINPHFLFNALNSVRALTLSDPHRARTAVTQLADLLRYTLQYEQRQLIPLAEELAAVLTLVENAVKHGLSARPEGGELRLLAQPTADQTALCLSVSQPGQVVNPLPNASASASGIGLPNTRQRLLALYGAAATLTLQEQPPGTVTATLRLPRQRHTQADEQ